MEEIKKAKDREGEKGAVMVMVLLISFLLLVASAGILLETSMNTRNVSDATADQQAYNAAESGIQSALNVLRGNVAPNPLLDSTKASTNIANQIDFIKALKTSTSNLSSDASTTPRLSRWGLAYTGADRVTIGGNSEYGFSVTLDDPDNAGSALTYNTNTGTSGFYNSSTSTYNSSMTFGSGGNTATVTYNPVSSTTANVSGGAANVGFGSFTVTSAGTGATVPTDGVRFQISVTMTFPYTTTKIMRGTLLAGTISSSSVGSVKFDFDSGVFNMMGSYITLASDPLTPNPPSTGGGVTNITGSVTQAEPLKILIRSTGYGPRGAQKQLEAIVQKNYFDGLGAPAALTLVGPNAGMVFKAGNSARVTYSGDDVASNINIPSVGVTNQATLDYVVANSPKTDLDPPAANVSGEMPDWLSNPLALDTAVQNLYNVAKASGRYFRSEVGTPSSFGDNYSATGITFVDGNVAFSGSGGGILVVTGKLTLDGDVNFNGLIIVTGSEGLDRSGGGGGTLQGNTVVAPYANSRIYSSTGTLVSKTAITTSTSFLPPKYDISGGGNSDLIYNSSSVANGMTAINNLVLGIAEK